ncbi:hypothetical protein LOZ66_003514 [Ophidiomyces ophidiicola]|nr:hypothetical protein LOZ66_003514 [Ophidiomyces ophidiicola]
MELREMIYVHLFKRGRLHVWYFGSKDSKVFREGWWHTVCHRLADYGTDRCRTRPIAAQKNFLTHEQIEIARLQVFGWLLSCSRAYHESIHFLYSANTFSIEPNYFPPFSDVKRLFPSHCLSAVRSLELLYPVATYRDLPVLDRFTSTIAHIPLIFPHLRSFHIAISSWWMLCALEHWENFAADHSELVKSELLGTLDGLVRRFNGQLRDCELTVDPNYYEIVKVLEDDRTGPAEASMFNWSKKTLTKRHWRQLDGETDSMKSKLGYWIVMAC